MNIHTAIAETITVNLDEANIFKATSKDEVNARNYEFAKVNNAKYPAVITKKFTKDKAYTDALRNVFPSHSSIVKLVNIISEQGIAIGSVKIRPTYFLISFHRRETVAKTQELVDKIKQEFSGIKVTPQTGWHDTNTNVGISITPEMGRMRYNFDESVKLDEDDVFKPASDKDAKERDAQNPRPRWSYDTLKNKFPDEVETLEAYGLEPDLDPEDNHRLGFVDRSYGDIYTIEDLPDVMQSITRHVLAAAKTLDDAVRK